MSEIIDWKKCTVTELRDHCAKYGLVTVGRKQELVDRLEKHCATENLSVKDKSAEMKQPDGSKALQGKSPVKSASNGPTQTIGQQQGKAQPQGAVKPKEVPKTPVVKSDTTAETKPKGEDTEGKEAAETKPQGEDAEGKEGHINDYLKRRRMFFGYNAAKCVRTVFIAPFKKELLVSENLQKWLDFAQTFRIGKNEDGVSGLVMVFKLSDQGDAAYFDLSNDFAHLDVEVYHPKHPNVEGSSNDIMEALNKDVTMFCPETSDGGLTKRTIVLENVPADYLCEEKLFQLFPDVHDVFVFPNTNPVAGKVLLDFASEEAADNFLKTQGNEITVEGFKTIAKKYSATCNKYLRAFYKVIRGEEIELDDETRVAMCKDCAKFKENLQEIINGEEHFGTGKISKIDQFNEDHITQKRHLALDTKRRLHNKETTMPEGEELMTHGIRHVLGLPHLGSAEKNKEDENKDMEDDMPEKSADKESEHKPGSKEEDKSATSSAAVKRKLKESGTASKEKPPVPKLMKQMPQKQLQGTQGRKPTPLMAASHQQKSSFQRGGPQGAGNQGNLFQRPTNQGPGFQNQGNRGMGLQGNRGPGFFNQGNMGSGQNQGNQGMGLQNQGNRGPGFQNQGNMGPGLQGNQAMGFQNQGNRNPGFQNQRNTGPGFLSEGNQNMGFQNQGRPGMNFQNQGPGFQNQGGGGPGFQNQGNQGPEFQSQGSQENRGPGFQRPANQGPGSHGPGFQGQQGSQGQGFQGRGNQGTAFDGPGNQGPGFQGQRNQGPGFQGQRNQGPGFQGQNNQDIGPSQRQFNQQKQWPDSQKSDTDALLAGLADAVVSKLQKQVNPGSDGSDTLSQFYGGKDIPSTDRPGAGGGFSGPGPNRGGPPSGGFNRGPMMNPLEAFRSNLM